MVAPPVLVYQPLPTAAQDGFCVRLPLPVLTVSLVYKAPESEPLPPCKALPLPPAALCVPPSPPRAEDASVPSPPVVPPPPPPALPQLSVPLSPPEPAPPAIIKALL